MLAVVFAELPVSVSEYVPAGVPGSPLAPPLLPPPHPALQRLSTTKAATIHANPAQWFGIGLAAGRGDPSDKGDPGTSSTASDFTSSSTMPSAATIQSKSGNILHERIP